MPLYFTLESCLFSPVAFIFLFINGVFWDSMIVKLYVSVSVSVSILELIIILVEYPACKHNLCKSSANCSDFVSYILVPLFIICPSPNIILSISILHCVFVKYHTQFGKDLLLELIFNDSI